MRIPRFHLSTLSLGCLLIGAIIGLYLHGNVWQLERSSFVDPNWGIGHEPGFEWLSGMDFNYRGNEFAPGINEQAIFTQSLTAPSASVIVVRRTATGAFEPIQTIPVENAFVAMRYSPNGGHLAIWQHNRLDIYRRNRPYGWQGFLQMPLFWVAAACFVLLCMNPIRRLLRRKSSTRDLSAATTVT